MRRRKLNVPHPHRRVSVHHSDGSVRTASPSGQFSALEADFFARESELYAVEPADTFEDLEEEV